MNNNGNLLLFCIVLVFPIIIFIALFFKYKKFKKNINQDFLDFKRQQNFRARNDL